MAELKGGGEINIVKTLQCVMVPLLTVLVNWMMFYDDVRVS